jgi:tetratricopeptide (TPR) repeat protein
LSSASDVDFALARLASLLESDAAAAAREATQILRAHPGHAAALLLLGTAHRMMGDTRAAVTELENLAAEQPESAAVRLELGRALHDAGQDTQARVALERAVQLAPDLAPAWRELSLVHAACGDTAACDRAYARFEALAQEDMRLTEAAGALANERLDAASALLGRRLATSPHDVAALRMLAQVAMRREDYPQAERLLGECLRLAPGYSRARLDLVEVLFRQQRGAPMLPLLERLLAVDAGNQRYRTLLANAHSLLGRTALAIEILAALVREFPASPFVWLSYGHALRADGRQQEALAAYRKSIELQPGLGGAWIALADLKTYRFSRDEVAAMHEQLAREDMSSAERSQLEFALGKAREDLGDFAAAFEHYARANALRRALLHHDSANFSRFVQRTKAICTAEFFAARRGWGCPAPDPIFIVGLPRAGSTLLEQILASHSQVEGTRELTELLRMALELGDRDEPDKPPAYPQSLARLTRSQVADLGERYLAQTRAHRLLGRPRFIDKTGSNFLHVALIHLILPNARIIDARRSPMGGCLANFKQHFHSGGWFSYSLEDLGHYYRDYVSLLQHFDAVLPGRIYRVSYEDVVHDLEREVRALLEHCGLPFEATCLRFHETRRSVATVSSEQVRQPLYSGAVDQWRNFEPWLQPLKEALGDLAEADFRRPA